MLKNLTQTAYTTLEMTDGVLVITFLPGIEITLDVAREIVQTRKNLTGLRSYPGLADVRQVKSVTRDAREFLSSDEATQGVSAAAMLVDSAFSSFLVNFFMSVTASKRKVPTKLFSDRKKAIQWLTRYVDAANTA
jgi:hypothetical protein